ncbi:MAG: ABC transporter substrate-binding protein [Chloroflexi bacterium]|nr:ABC transporter substrate-binding protein [Chloroflexota bacterium]MCY4247371.1 ABC transporter substrate-binding protein [Chloroflexota bacterium]
MKHLIALLTLLALLPGAAAQDMVELDFMCYENGNECSVYDDLLNRFSEDNPGITVKVNTVPYTTVRDQLRVQVEAGQAPDIARITDFAGMAGFYLDLRPLIEDPTLMEDNFPAAILEAFRADDDMSGLYGFPDAATVTAPFVNATLFAQAGIDMPSAVMDEPSWEDWLAVLDEVAGATGVQYAIAIDNKGHRFAGPAMSLGADFFDDEGNFDLADDVGFRAFAMILKDLIDTGKSPAETWLGTSQYTGAQDYFINVEAVMYFSGSWQIGRFSNDIGDAFDWVVVPNPYGPGGSTGVAGGAALVGYAATEHPEAVAMALEYLMQPEVYGEFSSRTLGIPGHNAVAAMGVDYPTASPAVAAALNGFASEVPKLQNQAVALNPHPLAFAYYDASNTRLAQYFAGELTLDEAMSRLQEQLDEAAANMAAG